MCFFLLFLLFQAYYTTDVGITEFGFLLNLSAVVVVSLHLAVETLHWVSLLLRKRMASLTLSSQPLSLPPSLFVSLPPSLSLLSLSSDGCPSCHPLGQCGCDIHHQLHLHCH